MGNSVKKNYLYNLSYEILAIIIPIVTLPYVSRVLGATAVGDYDYIFGIVSYFGIVAVTGTKNFGQREIAKNQNNKHNKSILFWEVFYFRLISTVIITLVYSIFILYFLPQYRVLFVVHYMTIISWVADISWYFQGTENFKVTSIRNTIVKLVGTILIFLLVKNPGDLWKYTTIYALTMLLGNVIMWLSLFREITIIKFSDLRIFANTKEIMALFLPVVAIQLYTVFDKTMLGTMCNTTEVGYYGQAEKIIKLLLTIITSFVAVLLPKIAFLSSESGEKEAGKYIEKVFGYIYVLACPMLVGCIVISNQFVPIFLGDGYDPVKNLMKIESLLFIVLGTGQMFGTTLVALNRQKNVSIAVISAAVTNIVFNYIFIKCFNLGAFGVAMASVLAETCSTLLQFIGLKDLVKISMIIKPMIKYMVVSVIMGCLVMFINIFMKDGIFVLVLKIIIAVIFYALMLFLIKDAILIKIIKQIIGKIKGN